MRPRQAETSLHLRRAMSELRLLYFFNCADPAIVAADPAQRLPALTSIEKWYQRDKCCDPCPFQLGQMMIFMAAVYILVDSSSVGFHSSNFSPGVTLFV